jgi:hypothetical protein
MLIRNSTICFLFGFGTTRKLGNSETTISKLCTFKGESTLDGHVLGEMDPLFNKKGYFRKHCCFSTVHEPNKARVGQITFVRPSTFVRFTSLYSVT